MNRSIEAWEQCQEEIAPLREKLTKYKANKIALRKNALNELETQYYALLRKLPEVCPHDQVSVVHGSYTDIGYGCDRHYHHYDLRCERCGSFLTSKTEGNNQRKEFGPVPLEEAIEWYLKRERLSDEELDKLGFRRHRKVVETITVKRNSWL